MDAEKYKIHLSFVQAEISDKLLELVSSYPDEIQFALIADGLSKLLSDYLENARANMMEGRDAGKYFFSLMKSRLDAIAKKYFETKPHLLEEMIND